MKAKQANWDLKSSKYCWKCTMKILHTVDNHYAIADLWKKSEKAAALAAEKEITHMNTKVIEVRSFTIDDHKMVEDRTIRISLPKKVAKAVLTKGSMGW